ncbi:MAG: DUF4126 domain-containing protein [Proteobacteria bacterium]|nr:DUF4126 domain-containing protein [Pseudomonadota bacterium]MBU1056862.1 DUF4126 domain-containing protein [Pseudomonadota bacterium]
MDAYQQLITTIALTMGTAWAAGINLYATIAVLGYLGLSGNVVLPEQLLVLQDPMVIGAAAFMYLIEFFVDKTPGVDTGWDTIHSFIRIPAGVLLAAGAVGEVNPSMVVVAGILGGGVAATTHAIKAGSRVLINTSPEPFTNWTASVLEDITVVTGLWAALHYPLAFLLFFIVFLLAAAWILPKIWTGIKTVFQRLIALFSGQTPPPRPDGGKTKAKELPLS